MDAEKFQELVLDHLARLTQDITELRSETKTELTSVKDELTIVKHDLSTVKDEITTINHRLDTLDKVAADVEIIKAQTAELTEFKTEVNLKLDQTIAETAQLRHDVTGLQNEKFEIKRIK